MYQRAAPVAGCLDSNVRFRMKRKHRLAFFAWAVAALLPSCASQIYSSGKYSDVLKQGVARSVIRSTIGDPIREGRIPKDQGLAGHRFDRFDAVGPVYDPYEEQVAAMASVLTFGLGELQVLPMAIAWRADEDRPREILVVYDHDDTYLRHSVAAGSLGSQ